MIGRRLVLKMLAASGLAAVSIPPPEPGPYGLQGGIVGKEVGTYNEASETTAPITSRAGKVQVFSLPLLTGSALGSWNPVPPSGQAATATVQSDGSLIVTALATTKHPYVQTIFAETIWQSCTVTGPTPPGAPPPTTTTTTTTTTTPPATTTSS